MSKKKGNNEYQSHILRIVQKDEGAELERELAGTLIYSAKFLDVGVC